MVDRGSTRNQIFSSPVSLISAFYLNPGKVWLLGLSDIDWFCYALYTGDNFQNYEIMKDFDDGTSSIFFSDHDNGWSVGDELVYKTTNGGGAFSVQEANTHSPIIRVFPNPSSGAVRLTVDG